MTERLWFKIGEAAALVGATPKDFRYWERVIPELKPRRSKGNLRYYHVDELPRLRRIKEWLAEGFTVADCRELLLTGHLARGLDLGLDEAPAPPPRRPAPPAPPHPPAAGRAELGPVLAALRALLAQLSAPPRDARETRLDAPRPAS